VGKGLVAVVAGGVFAVVGTISHFAGVMKPLTRPVGQLLDKAPVLAQPGVEVGSAVSDRVSRSLQKSRTAELAGMRGATERSPAVVSASSRQVINGWERLQSPPYRSTTEAVADIVSRSEGVVLRGLDETSSVPRIKTVIENALASSALEAAQKPNANIEFEALTGKLRIKSSTTVSGVKVTGGEVNLYKISGGAAAGIATCYALDASEVAACVKKALSTAGRLVAPEAKPAMAAK
jgi:hypothetical protein